MKVGRTWRAVTLGMAALALLPACKGRKPAEVNAITPSFAVNRGRTPLGSAVEVTYTWTVEPSAKKLTQDYRAFVHFKDPQRMLLFTDDHVPTPAPTTWEPGKTYTYTRTLFVPIYPYVGNVDVVMGLYPASGKGERVALKGEDRGLREYKVASNGAPAPDRQHLPRLQGRLAQPRDLASRTRAWSAPGRSGTRWCPSRTPRRT